MAVFCLAFGLWTSSWPALVFGLVFAATTGLFALQYRRQQRHEATREGGSTS